MKVFPSLFVALGIVAGVTLGSSTVHAKPLCIRLSSGEHLVFPIFRATKGKVRSVVGYHRTAGLAAGLYGTTIASASGSNVAIGVTVPGVSVASGGSIVGTSTTSWNLVKSQAVNARLLEGDLLTQCGRRDSASGPVSLGCEQNVAEVVDCKTVPPVP